MMTTLKVKRHTEGDDFDNRLLSFLKKKLGDPSATLKRLKEGKWLLTTHNKKWFVKLYSNSKKFYIQKHLVDELLKKNFQHVLPFHPIHTKKELLFEGKPVGITYWLDTKETFTYVNQCDRQDALAVLKSFHKQTQHLKGKWTNEIPPNKWVEKWEERLYMFQVNIPFLQSFIQPFYLYTYLQWGKWSLEQLKKIELPLDEICILHGDVAHHNFLRAESGKVYIIDFDLITIAPPMIDDLQFSNRILPYINWSLQKLWFHEPLNSYKRDNLFIVGLMYPSDIFREWNRFAREGKLYKQKVWSYLYSLTVKQFSQRMTYMQELHNKFNLLK
jgi:hypothetical protein